MTEGALVELVYSLGYVLLDDWEGYKVAEWHDTGHWIISFERSALEWISPCVLKEFLV
jgi:hypothetical protein